MKDNCARERIDHLERELSEVKWELRRAISRIESFLGVTVEKTPAREVLVKKEVKKEDENGPS